MRKRLGKLDFASHAAREKGVSPNWGYLLGVPIVRIVVSWALYWGPPT